MSYSGGRRGFAPYPLPQGNGERGEGGVGYAGGHGGSGYGGGGRGRRERRGGSSGGFGRAPPGPPISLEPQNLVVKTNLFEVNYVGDYQGQIWFKYKLVLTPKQGRTDKDRDKSWEELPDAHPAKLERLQKNMAYNGSTELTREVFLKLSDHIFARTNTVLATDSVQTGISAKALWNFDESQEKEYLIELSSRQCYKVTLIFTDEIPLGIWFSHPQSHQELATSDRIKQCLEILIKHGLTANCLAVGKNPEAFFLPENRQIELMKHSGRSPLGSYYDHPGSFAPYIGLSQSVRFGSNGKFLLAINNKVEWFYREGQPNEPGGLVPEIPILDRDKRTIAGISVDDLSQKVDDPFLRKQIEEAISKMTFKIVYKKGPQWINASRAKGKSERYIQEYLVHVKVRQVMRSRHPQGKEPAAGPLPPRIKWSCDEEKFDKKVGDNVEVYDVARYFKGIYDIVIEFPNMPIVCVGNGGFFPIEFLYQERSRFGGNAPDKVTKVLAYHDANAGAARVQHVKLVRDLAYQEGGDKSLEKLFEAFSIRVHRQPISTPAVHLPPPPLEFKNDVVQGVPRGSWNLRGKTFYSCADLPAYAVIDFCGGGRISADSIVSDIFQSMESHGMRILNQGRSHLRRLTIHNRGHNSPDSVLRCFHDAKAVAKEVFLGADAFFGAVVGPAGQIENTWLVKDDDGKWHRIPPSPDEPSHRIANILDPSKVADARLQFRTFDGRWLDPSEVPGDLQVDFKTKGFKINDWPDIIPISEVAPRPEFKFVVEDWQIECPALIFCFLPEVDTVLYNCVKAVCDLLVGTNTQCIVQATAERQSRGTQQLCSNIALKVNTKLFNKGNSAAAWILKDSLKWTTQKSTMILGYSFGHGRLNGKVATAIAGSVCLSHPMQMGQTVKFQRTEQISDVIDSGVLKQVIRDLAMNFFAHTDAVPERIVVFRDGGSTGSMENIKKYELQAVVEAFAEMNSEYQRDCPQDCPNRNCPSCAPRLTFIVSNKDHNMNIVPENESGRDNNVASGTLVKDLVDDFKLGSVGGDLEDDGGFSFLLTAQGGLKGTSKPMFYRCLVNQNKMPPLRFRNDPSVTGIDKDAIMRLVYDLSYQYGSATKSPRKIPVLLNSEKLANRAISYGSYLELARVSCQIIADDDNEVHLVRRDDVGKRLEGRLFEGYGVFDNRCTLSSTHFRPGWRVPFRPHITG